VRIVRLNDVCSSRTGFNLEVSKEDVFTFININKDRDADGVMVEFVEYILATLLKSSWERLKENRDLSLETKGT